MKAQPLTNVLIIFVLFVSFYLFLFSRILLIADQLIVVHIKCRVSEPVMRYIKRPFSQSDGDDGGEW